MQSYKNWVLKGAKIRGSNKQKVKSQIEAIIVFTVAEEYESYRTYAYYEIKVQDGAVKMIRYKFYAKGEVVSKSLY